MKIKSDFSLSFMLILVVVLTMSSLGCGSSGGDDDSSPVNTVLPNTLMVTVPKSLEGSGAQQSMRALRAVRDTESENRATEAYWTIKMGVEEMKGNGAMMAVFGAVIDELISSKGLSPSSEKHSDLTITMNQSLEDKIKNFAAAGGFDVDEMLAEFSGDVPVPPFTYNTASVPYNFSVKMTQTDAEGTYYTAFYWSSDKKKVKMAFADADLDVNAAAATYTYTITYDDSTKTSSMVSEYTYEGNLNTFTFSLKGDTASTKNGAFVFYEGSDSWDGVTWYQSGSGYADDAGGSLKVTVRTGSGKDTKVENYETAFDATTINAGLTDDYSGYVDQIDEDMYAEVGETEGMSGETSDYSVDIRVYTLAGVTVEDYADESYTSYVIFDKALTAGAEGSPVVIDSVDFTGKNYIGSGYGSAANELTAFLDEGSTATTGYVYEVKYDGTSTAWKYLKPITL